MRSQGRLLVAVVVVMVVTAVALAAKICPKCGTQNLDNAKFCKSCGYEFSQQFPALTVKVSVAFGRVEITSEPANAVVAIDGRRAGVTPFTSEELAPGKHELAVTLSGYREYRGSFIVPVASGAIRVLTIPSGVEVLVDGTRKGVTSDTGLFLSGLSSGSHQLVFRLAGHAEETRVVDLRVGETLVLEPVRLLQLPGFVDVASEPERAGVFVNGRSVGETRYFGQLAPARYELRLSKRRYQDWIGFVEVRGGETAMVMATLERMRDRKPVFLIAGLTGLAVCGAAVVSGEMSYARYQRAGTGEQAEKYRLATQRWDLVRNLAAGLGAVGVGAYILF